jgi:branched-chain amino acid transport system ATP-binding protein/branched-chain amino acid transport system permease protein
MTGFRLRLLGLAATALFALAPFLVSPFSVTLLNFIGIYALAALGLVLLTGIGGMLSFGQAAFVGIAAYATAWVTVVEGQSPWLGLLLALVVTGAVAAVLGAVTLRLKGHFLSLSTIAWGLAIYFAFGNIPGLGQFTGLDGVPPIAVFSLVLSSDRRIFYLIWAVLVGALFLSANLLGSREGRAMRALRGGQVLTESLGIDPFRVRLITFVVAALLSALSGWLYAHMSRFVSPSPFDVTEGILYLLMAMVGGMGHILGAVAGAAIVTLMRNYIQDWLPMIAPGASSQLQIVVFAVLFIFLLQRARAGIVPHVLRYLPRPKPAPLPPAPPLEARRQPLFGEPILSITGVLRKFGGLVAVNNVGFDLHAGEILGLIGPNGAGKTTMFNLISGALPAHAGSVRFRGTEITRLSQRRIARLGIARTFQHVKLRADMTLLDNVLLGTYPRTRAGFIAGALRLDRREETRARREAMRQLARMHLEERAYDLAGNLPLGEQRLLEIARALAADPVLLLLDEPAAGLRSSEKAELAQLMRKLRSEGFTILLVEHDMEFVMGLVDRTVVMDFGAKLCEGPPAEIRVDPRVQEAYLGGVA